MLKRGRGFSKFIRDLEGGPHTEEQPKYYYTGDGVDKGALKMFLVNPELERGLVDSFVWNESPQGHKHWSLIRRGMSEATEKDLDYLKWLLENYEESLYDL